MINRILYSGALGMALVTLSTDAYADADGDGDGTLREIFELLHHLGL